MPPHFLKISCSALVLTALCSGLFCFLVVFPLCQDVRLILNTCPRCTGGHGMPVGMLPVHLQPPCPTMAWVSSCYCSSYHFSPCALLAVPLGATLQSPHMPAWTAVPRLPLNDPLPLQWHGLTALGALLWAAWAARVHSNPQMLAGCYCGRYPHCTIPRCLLSESREKHWWTHTLHTSPFSALPPFSLDFGSCA